MKKFPTPHPSGRPGQLCLTREMDPPVFRLPEGLSPGILVRTLEFAVGAWIVEEVNPPGRRFRVEINLLDVLPQFRR